MAANRIHLYDTTLRDGTQGEGFNLSLEDKLRIAYRMDDLGVDYIEGGFPVSNPKDEAFFREIAKKPPRHAKVSAFGMTRRRGTAAKDDATLAALLAAQTPAVTVVGKTSDVQVRTVMNVSPEENLAMIADSVRLLCDAGREVIFDAEHFFDTFAGNPDYALAVLRSAEQAGATTLCLCDTNGGTMPEAIAAAVERVRGECSVEIGIHTHNDCGLAVANALAAVRAGAAHVQGTVNGVGERCGNMDLLPLAANLHFKYGLACLPDGKFEKLTELSRFVYETANQNPTNGQPYVGLSAFAHKGGMHVHAVQKDSSSYEHVRPESVGNTRKILVSELSGASNIAATVGKKFGIENDKDTLRAVLNTVQNLENDGYQFEAAEASFELLLRRQIGRARTFFDLQRYRVTTQRADDGEATAEASVKLTVDGHPEHRVAEGNGPVDSLAGALRKALKDHYASVVDLHLSDYKVRVVNSSDETAAKVRVVIEWKRKTDCAAPEHFGTIGVSGNVIEATWQALRDGYEYHLTHVEESGTEVAR